MKLRALIWGVHEFDEIPGDYFNKTEAGVLAAQRLIASEDPISFCYPSNVHVSIQEATEPHFTDKIPVPYLKDTKNPAIRNHLLQAYYHLSEINHLLEEKK
jgi:hypothetical protein